MQYIKIFNLTNIIKNVNFFETREVSPNNGVINLNFYKENEEYKVQNLNSFVKNEYIKKYNLEYLDNLIWLRFYENKTRKIEIAEQYEKYSIKTKHGIFLNCETIDLNNDLKILLAPYFSNGIELKNEIGYIYGWSKWILCLNKEIKLKEFDNVIEISKSYNQIPA